MNKSIVITGAATGIGLATARLFSEHGWRVEATALPDQPTSELESLDQVSIHRVDITQEDSVTEFGNKLASSLDNGLDVLVNSAGNAQVAAGVIEGVSLDNAKKLFEINVFGTLRVTQTLLPLLRKRAGSHLINVTSSNVRVPVPISGIYMMSKSALEAMTKTMRLELAPFGVNVTAVEPGAVESPMTDNAQRNIADTWAQTPPDVRAVYEPEIGIATERLIQQLVKRNPPTLIAQKIWEIANTHRPQPRYTVGYEVKWLPLAQRLMSESRFESVLLKTYGIRRQKAVA